MWLITSQRSRVGVGVGIDKSARGIRYFAFLSRLTLLLLESLHDSRPLLGAGSGSGVVNSSRCVGGWGRLAGVSLSVHTHILTLSVHPR